MSLTDGLALSGLTSTELWLAYVSLGGLSSEADVLRHIECSTECANELDHNLIAQALNDTFVGLGHGHLVGYVGQRQVWPLATADRLDELAAFLIDRTEPAIGRIVHQVMTSPLYVSRNHRQAVLYEYCLARGFTAADGLDPAWESRQEPRPRPL